jgi:predicted DsbA family dithiol-disulfide isomerase
MTYDSDSSTADRQPGAVTVWSDIGCPWATLALHTLHATASARGQRITVIHRAFPLELFNRMPTPKFIVDAEVTVIGGRHPELGWRPWRAAESTYPVTTLPALEAVQAAKDPAVGGPRASDELDAALRAAFYRDHLCISIPSVVLDIAAGCEHVDCDALANAIARGAGRAEVYQDWRIAQGPAVQGSPHLFAAGGFARHNPGVVYHWSDHPPTGFPVYESYCDHWAGELLDLLAGQAAELGATVTAPLA